MSDHQNGLEKEVVDSALRKSHNKIPKTDFSRFIVIGSAPRRFDGHEFPGDRMNQVSHRWFEEGRLFKAAMRKNHNKFPKTHSSRFIAIGRATRRLDGHEFPRDPMNQVSHRWLEEGRLLKRGEDLMDQERSRRIRLYGGDRELTLEEILNLNAGFAPEWNCRLK